MKLRIKDNSIRFRLNQTEVARLAEGGVVQQTTTFAPGQQLTCVIQPSRTLGVAISFEHGSIVLRVSNAMLDRWANTDDVGITATQRIDRETDSTILLEKDFECLHPGHDIEADAFPHPAEHALHA